MNLSLDENEEIVWQNLVNAFFSYVEASGVFFKPEVDHVKLLREGFRRGDIAVALDIASSLDSSKVSELLPELVNMSTAHGYALRAREIILSLPHNWLITCIEEVAEPILQSGDDFEFRQIFQLYLEIDRTLAVKLGEKAINGSDEYIREVGKELLEQISKIKPTPD